MNKLLLLLLAAASLPLLSPAAHAGFQSGDGTEVCSYAGNSGPCYVVDPHPVWSPLGVWVSHMPTGSFFPSTPSWTLTDSYTAVTDETWDILFLADDTAAITIDGVAIWPDLAPNFDQFVCGRGPLGCEIGEEVWYRYSLNAGQTAELHMEVYNLGRVPGNMTGAAYSSVQVDPVPVPPSIALAAAGIGGLALLRSRRKQA